VTFTPLVVTATLCESIVLRRRPMLDGILAAVVAMRQGLVPIGNPLDWPELPIPVAKSPCGRYWLASAGHFDSDAHYVSHKHRRAPWVEYARLGAPSIRRVETACGEDKSYRTPYSSSLLADDRIVWWCLGGPEAVADLLSDCHYLGRFRGAGHGRVRLPWSVEPCESWPGFPVLRDGMPLRPLPLDVEGLAPSARRGYHGLIPPYWCHEREGLAAVPC
jgi:CRISPR type IV-associated protein Csf3